MTVQALLEASQAEKQKLVEAQLLKLQRLERDLLLSQKDRRVREALEYAISIIRGSEDSAYEGGEIPFLLCDCLPVSPGHVLVAAGFRHNPLL